LRPDTSLAPADDDRLVALSLDLEPRRADARFIADVVSPGGDDLGEASAAAALLLGCMHRYDDI
jgi:hypothetical protein